MKVKVIECKPTSVKIKYLHNGKVISVGRTFFEKRRDLGFFDVTNPEVLPVAI